MKISSDSKMSRFVMSMADNTVYTLSNSSGTLAFDTGMPDNTRHKIGKMCVVMSQNCLIVWSDSITSSHELNIDISPPLCSQTECAFRSSRSVSEIKIPENTSQITVEHIASEGLFIEYNESPDCNDNISGDEFIGDKPDTSQECSPCSSDGSDEIERLRADIRRIAPEETSRLEALECSADLRLNEIIENINKKRTAIRNKNNEIKRLQTELCRDEEKLVRTNESLKKAQQMYNEKHLATETAEKQLEMLIGRMNVDRKAVECYSSACSDNEKSDLLKATELISEAEKIINSLITKRQELSDTAITKT